VSGEPTPAEIRQVWEEWLEFLRERRAKRLARQRSAEAEAGEEVRTGKRDAA
jgi:hypothetical protein